MGVVWSGIPPVADTRPARLELGGRACVARLKRYLERAPTLGEQISDIDSVDLRLDERIPVTRKKPAASAGRSATEAGRGKN